MWSLASSICRRVVPRWRVMAPKRLINQSPGKRLIDSSTRIRGLDEEIIKLKQQLENNINTEKSERARIYTHYLSYVS